ncbi:MAG TPA: hypothetical protein VF950_30730 [Planctomycetota bacterium]
MPDTKWTYPDGSSITEHEDGSFTVTEANGAKTHYDDDTGRRTETPAPGAGGQPTVTNPNQPPKTDNGEIEIRYPDGTRVYIRLNPKRFRIVRSAPAAPRKWEVEMPNGTRNVQQVKDGDITTTPPTTQQPESITPSTHPAPATPAPTPTPEGGGSAKPKPSKPKKKPKKPARKPSKAKKKKRR